MAITRWDPFRDVLALQNRMNSLFQEYNRTQGEGDALTTAAFVPPVDIYEDEHKIVLKLELEKRPEAKPKQIKVEIGKGQIEGGKKEVKPAA